MKIATRAVGEWWNHPSEIDIILSLNIQQECIDSLKPWRKKITIKPKLQQISST
jgi:hypothetical protein